MIKTLLLTLMLSISSVLSSMAQSVPIDLYYGTSNQLSYSWSSNFATSPAPTTANSPYEGADHFLFDYNIPSGWWAGGAFSVNSWGGITQNFNNHTHMVIAYKGASAYNNKLGFSFTDNAGITGASVLVASNSATYKIDTIPLSLFKGATALNFGNLTTLNFYIAAANASTTGQFYIDNIRIIDLSHVKAGAANISPYGSFDFGSANVNTTTASTTFTIENLGTTNLTLTGTPKIVISGANASDFTINQTTVTSPVTPLSNTTFTVAFNPATTGLKNAVLTIANNYSGYSSNGAYVINLTGTATAPEINLKAGATNIATAGSYDFGSSNIGTLTSATTFTIENLGTGPLTLSGTPRIILSGANAADFIIDSTSLSSPLAASGTTTFTIKFNPSATGTKNASITIANDDADEGFYVINLSGTGTAPEINITAAASNISSGGSYDFGSLVSGTSGSPVTFTIQNLGNIDLNLTGTPRVAISGADAADFTIDSSSIASPVSASGSTSVTITFTPSALGARIAAITIANDDSNEGTYVINLTGTGTATPEPEINIKAATTSIPLGGSFDFGNSIQGTATAATTFTIENLGTADLTLSGSPAVSISGTNLADFTIVQTSVTSPVAASGTTSFTISFNPSATGSRTAAISISNDDSDEGTYVINLTGTGTPVPVPEINVKQGSNSIVSGNSFDFGSSNVGTSTSATTFTIENLGTANLILSGTPKIAISGSNGADFTIVQTALTSPVAASATTSFTIAFNPSAAGLRTASISISNNDSNKGTYVIDLTGTGNTVTALYGNSGSDTYEVYPSPFANEAVLKISSSLQVPVTVKVADSKGMIVYTSEDFFTNQDISFGNELEKGIYFVQVTYQNRVQVIKIVKI
jgi:hypothetical protein